MSKHKNKTSAPPVPQPQIVSTATSDYVDTASKEYAIYTAQNRAIPSVCDGLKDGQRKMLWVIRNKSEKVKTVSLSGAAIQEGIFHHGDQSASDTISRLAAPYLNNIPLLEGLGAFGTRVSPDGWGAPRYTYVKKSKATETLVYPDLDIMPLKPNYDGSVLEPENFLPLIPLVLLNGVSGIAVGWSTEILPHSLKDIVAATVAAIDDKPMPHLTPNFDYLQTQVRELSMNSYEFTGKVIIESATTIRVQELPPDLSLERFKERLNKMEDEGQIHMYQDRSTKTIDVEVRFKRGVIDKWNEQTAIDFLKLKSKTTQRFVVLHFNNKSIRQYDSATDLVREFVNWRMSWFSKRYTLMRDNLLLELNQACGIQACLKGGLPRWLPTAENKAAVTEKVRSLTKHIDLTSDQIDRIVSLPTYRWAKDAIEKVEGEIQELSEQIVSYEQILQDPKKIRSIYREEVLALLKHKF
jgi:DNA gyrase/topoisomerase IV subunit A